MATIRQLQTPAGERWDVQIRRKGHKPIHRRFKSKVLAEREARKIEQEIDAGKVYQKAEGERRTLAEAVERYRATLLKRLSPRTQATDEARLQWWRDQFGEMLVSAITPALISAAIDRLETEGPGDTQGRRAALGGGVSTTTSGHYLKTLRRLFNVAIHQWQWIQENPAEKVQRPKPRPAREKYLDDPQRTRLLAACRDSRSPHLHPIVLLLVTTGARFSEIAGLRWKQINFGKGTITLGAQDTKGRRGRTLPLLPEAAELLKAIKAERVVISEQVFPQAQDPTKHLTTLKRAWRGVCREVGLRDFTLHDLRHDFASRLVMNGASLSALAELLGHRSLDMVQRYAHLKQDHALDEARRILTGSGRS